jgi:predicted Zn-dependent peptidase
MPTRLWQRLRETQGLAYNIGSFVNAFHDAGVLGVYGGCDATRLFEALNGIMSIWRELQESPISHEELDRFKDYLRGRTELASEDPMGVAAWWGQQLATGAEPLMLDQALAQIDAVTPEDIQRLAQALWLPQKLSLAYVGTLENEELLVSWLEGLR